MLAIALVMEGSDRAAAARSCGMDRQTLRDWVYRYNAGGLAGLSNRTAPGRTPYLSAAQKAELSEIVRAGPDPEVDRVVRWRRIDLKHLIKERFGVVMHERTVGKQLAELGFRRLSVRPAHPQSDPAAQAAFKKKLRALVAAALPPEARGKPSSGSRMKRGSDSRERSPVFGPGAEPARARHVILATNGLTYGAVCPERAAAAALVMPFADTQAMNEHLAEIAKTVVPGAHAVIVLDGAGWHGSKALCTPDNITLLPLPPYAPELNPIENPGPTCAPTNSPSPSSTVTTTSSRSAATRGTSFKTFTRRKKRHSIRPLVLSVNTPPVVRESDFSSEVAHFFCRLMLGT